MKAQSQNIPVLRATVSVIQLLKFGDHWPNSVFKRSIFILQLYITRLDDASRLVNISKYCQNQIFLKDWFNQLIQLFLLSYQIYLNLKCYFFKVIIIHTIFMRGCHEHHPFFGHDNEDSGKIKRIVSEIAEACKGAGTDEKQLIRVTAECNAMERDAVCKLFSQQKGKSLNGLLQKELSGNLEKLFTAMYTQRYVFWAEQIHEAVKGAGTNEKKLIDLLVSCADNEYREVDRVYTQLYKRCIHETVSSECGASNWGKLMKAWLKNENAFQGSPQHLAEALFAAAKGAGTDEEVFTHILTSVTHQTYQAVDAEFSRLYQKSLRSVIKSEFTGKAEYAYLAVHDYLVDPIRFVANMLSESMKGAGTNDDKLIYTTVLHSDWCGPYIERAYDMMGFGNLKKDIKRDLTGKYEDAILALWHL
uniref:Annexin 12 n=1 Tax=Spironucleus vortens TaxID=58336 RepID=A0A142C680_SPIVO|nr:annexin 12 [Spironucleus vortens]